MKISRREWLVALIVSLSMVLLLALPYWLGHVLARPDTYFTGLIMNPEDSQSYFAKMLQGYLGRWLYAIPFTPEAHQPAFIGGFYLGLGHVARLFGLSLVQIWHLARIAAGLFLSLTTFGFVASFLHRPRWRWTAYLLAVLGSGLGWMLLILGQSRWLGDFLVDFRMPESHLFFTAFTFPHVAAGTGLLLLIYWLCLRAFGGERRDWLYALAAGLANILLGIIYPFLIYLITAVAGIYWIYLSYRRRKPLWREAGLAAIIFAIPLPLYLYYAYTLQVNDVFRAWSEQAGTLSPPWPHYLIAYGVLLVLALLPLLRRSWRAQIDDSLAFLFLWLLAAAVLLYGPFTQQRRFAQGLQVPLSILATVGLKTAIVPWLTATRPFKAVAARPRYSPDGLTNLFLLSFVALSAIGSLYLLADVTASTTLVQPYPFFRTDEEATAAAWLGENGEPAGVVLASYVTGNYVAAQTGNPVVVGHWAETVNWGSRLEKSNAFYSLTVDDAWRQQFLADNSVRYVWHGPFERTIGDYDPADSSFLQLQYGGPETQIYAVRP